MTKFKNTNSILFSLEETYRNNSRSESSLKFLQIQSVQSSTPLSWGFKPPRAKVVLQEEPEQVTLLQAHLQRQWPPGSTNEMCPDRWILWNTQEQGHTWLRRGKDFNRDTFSAAKVHSSSELIHSASLPTESLKLDWPLWSKTLWSLINIRRWQIVTCFKGEVLDFLS
jgi:hypothetical protein